MMQRSSQSSDESTTDEELLIHPDAPSARSRPRAPVRPRASGPAPAAPAPRSLGPKATRVRQLVEEDWTWLEEDSDEFEREMRQQRSARRKRAKRAKSESLAQVQAKQLLRYQN